MEAKKVRSVRFNENELETVSIIYPVIEEQDETSTQMFDPYLDDDLSHCRHSIKKHHMSDDLEFTRSGSHSLLYDKLSSDFESTSIRTKKKRDNDLDISHHVSQRHSTTAKIGGSSYFKNNDDLDTSRHQRRCEKMELCY